MPAFSPDRLRPGDCLLYGPRGWVGWLIALKTWHRISHVEVYEGVNGTHKSVASRDGRGVNRWTLRTDDLVMVLRPVGDFDQTAATAWFEKIARGQKYDFRALLNFLWPRADDVDPDMDRQICSAFAARYYRAGGIKAFSDCEDADKIAPFQFAVSPAFDVVWRL